MSEKSTLLPLPAAIDAAYLLLVGQLCISLSKLAFGLSYVAENNILISPSWESITVWSLSAIILVMLFINILSCWKSTRATFDEIGHYPNALLSSDIFILVAFFFLNSVAAAPINFMQSLTLDTPSIQKFVSDIERLWEPVIPLLFLSSSLLVFSYRNWNKAYLKEISKTASSEDANAQGLLLEKFNSLYVLFGMLFIAFAVLQVLFDQFFMTISLVFVWVFFWLYINFSWLIWPPTEHD